MRETRILGVDVGKVRIGVAISDPLGITAQPLLVIDRKREDPFKQLASLIESHAVDTVVVGHPLRLDGSAGDAVKTVEKFIERLKTKTSARIELWDERLTTAAAERSMIEGGARREERREKIDKVAAALILQSYLDAHAG